MGDALTKRVGKGVREPGRLPAEKKEKDKQEEPNPPAPFPEGKGVVTGLQNRTTDTRAQDAEPEFTPFPSGKGAGGLGSCADDSKPSFSSSLVFPLHKQHNHA